MQVPTEVLMGPIPAIGAGLGLILFAGLPGAAFAYRIVKGTPKDRPAQGVSLANGDRMMLGEIRGELKHITRELARQTDAIDTIHADLDKRIRLVEAWQERRAALEEQKR